MDLVDLASIPTARRANLEDLPALLALWEKSRLPGIQLEKFLTEFQIVANERGEVLASVGLQVDGPDALVHSEAVADAASPEAEAHRAALWTRMQIVLRNQGVSRVWTLEDDAYWQSVFQPAKPGEIAALKSTFADPAASWLMIQLLDEARVNKLVNEQVILRGGSLDGERQEFNETIRRARLIAYSITMIVIIILVTFAIYLLNHREVLGRVLRSQ